MKKIKSEHIISGLFVFIIMFFMCAVLVRVAGQKLFHINFEENNAAEKGGITVETANTDWAAIYPFDEKYVFDFVSDEPVQTEEVKEWTFSDTVKTAESRVDYFTSNLLFGRMKFVEANALFNKSVGMKIISGNDTVVAMTNGYLTFQEMEMDTEYAAKSFKWFSDNLAQKGIGCKYIQLPSKESPYENRMPVGIIDNNNINADSLLENMKKENAPFVDFRVLLNSSTDNWYGSFFRTDHHWLPETGVWAAGKIAEILNKEFGYDIDTDIGNTDRYNVKVYKNYCLGSQGRAATLKYADPEDISLITLKNRSDFTVRYDSDDAITGDFCTSEIDMKALERIDYYNLSPYSAYLYGNHAVTSIRNNQLHNGKRLLVLSDSFSRCVIPFLSQEIEYIDVVDRRYFSGSIMNYIEQFKPDTVLVAYNPTMITSISTHSGMYNFE